ncbi:hypothetical protein [Caenimonas aquaedulcis]|uniref:Nucleoside-diphosphate sugar epimerase n=1 Tax=Caenimonas aquaedulcis TaxID=2793270 RepID=A0A931H579_9BURK|nr:hypothetical protein [Caenimonas aquaedulcis]MBG9388688.1 hypothetical protein [Caenimonas aquaedulcis]
MHSGPVQVLAGALRPGKPIRQPTLLVAGATGTLGNEVMRRLVGHQRFGATYVLAREPIQAGLRGVALHRVESDSPRQWPLLPADTGVILFEPPRLFHDRERALWTPQPGQLVELALWMRRSGVTTLAVVLPHAQGRLPEALKRGLAGLDEHAVSTLGFERLLFVRSAQRPGAAKERGFLPSTARWMLSIFRYMIPSSEQPVRSVKVAEFVASALRHATPGIHVAEPAVVWRAAQGDVDAVVREWLAR